jgi:two-component system KDP operon response regulator KdpE
MLAMTTDVILIIDDETQIRHALAGALCTDSARVVEACTATEGINSAASDPPDLVVLDLGLPDRPGIEVCRELRRWSNAPIVILSARQGESDKIALLNAGADDYVTKPFSLGEFAARVQAQLRRARIAQPATASLIELDGLEIDVPARRVTRDGVEIRLTPIEWSILVTLALQGGRPVTHQRIFDAVWGRSFGNPQQYLRVYVTHVRRKIEVDPSRPTIILTEPGVGYRFGRGDR